MSSTTDRLPADALRWVRPHWQGAVALLMVVAAAVRLPRSWTPLGDNGLMRMWTDAVGTRATPLIGGDSRFAWNHLGPWVFYLLAIPYRLLGTSAEGLLVGAAAIGIVSVWVTLRCVRSVAGEGAAAVVAIGALVFLVTAAGNRLIDPWNPYVVQLPFLLSVVTCWAVVNRQWRWLAWLVAACSLCVQSHIAFLPPSLVLLVIAVVAVVRAGRAETRSAVRAAGIVAFIAWLPTLIDLLLPHRHNLYRVVRFLARPSATGHNGLRAGVGVLLRETGLRASWLGGHLGLRLFTDAFDGGVGLLPGLGIVTLLAAGVHARRRRDRVAGSLVLIVALLVPVAVVEFTLGQGLLYPYLFGWVTIVGMLCWVTGALAVLQRLEGTAASLGAQVAALAVAAWLVVIGIGAALPRSPRERVGDAAIVRRLVAEAEVHLSRTTSYRLAHGSDSYSSVYEIGVVDGLRHDGYHIVVVPAAFVLFGRHMTDGHALSYATLSIVAPYEAAGPGDEVIALNDPLTATERAREASLISTLNDAYQADAKPDAARIVYDGEGDQVLIAGFAHPDPALDPLLRDLAKLRRRGRSVAVILHAGS